MITLYRFALYCLVPFVWVKLFLRILKAPDYKDRIGQRFGFISEKIDHGGFWIHAVSVGEVTAAVPLVKYLIATWPEKPVTVTTMTTTGAERVRKTLGDQVTHCYLPYDYPGAVKRFLEKVNPSLGLVMETEIWPNLISRCDKSNIPLIYCNVRLSERSFKGYQRFRHLFVSVLSKIDKFAVQSQPDAHRLMLLGAPEASVAITGSMKFDIQMPASVEEAGQSVRRQIGLQRPTIVAASTHQGEEPQLLETYQKIIEQIDDALLVIVPRHPERFAEVYELCVKKGYSVTRRTVLSGELDVDTNILIVDVMGELPVFISAGDVTFMGGSLMPVGGHNLLEAASLCRPVVFGPHMFNFSEISEMFLEQGAGLQVQDADELASVLIKLLNDANARDQLGKQGEKLVEQNRGALQKVIEMIHSTINH